MAHLVIKNLNKVYNGTVEVLKNVNIEAEKGEFIVLVGPSGCGKSTLLRMIAGLEDITAGTIEIGGKVVNNVPPAKRDIAMVFQDYALYPHMSVEQNLSFGLKIQGMPKAEIQSRIQSAASMLDIDHLLHRKPSQLSGGQRQRVAIGRAIVRKPSMFLFDEPLSNLDAKLRSQTRIELAALHEKVGNTAVYVTHDQVEAMTLGHRICVLNRGVVQQFGRPLELYDTPANAFVGGFIGNPSMNFFSGTLKTVEGKRYFEMKDFNNQKVDCSSWPLPSQDGDYLLGVRPEDLSHGLKDGFDIHGRIVVVEPHGHESHTVITVGKQQFIMRSSSPDIFKLMTSWPKNEDAYFSIDGKKCHWFLAEADHLRVKTS